MNLRFFVPLCLIFVSLAGCAFLQSDDDLHSQAEKRVQALVEKGEFPESKRDSLLIESLIDVFYKAKRGESLVFAMTTTRSSESNPHASYGMAVGYAMQKNEFEAMRHLTMAVEGGDYHLSDTKDAGIFMFLAGNPHFQILLETSKTNKFKVIAEQNLKAIEPNLPYGD